MGVVCKLLNALKFNFNFAQTLNMETFPNLFHRTLQSTDCELTHCASKREDATYIQSPAHETGLWSGKGGIGEE